MSYSSKRSISLLLALVVLVGASLIYGFLLRPVYGDILNLRSSLLSKDQFLAEQQVILNKVNDLISQYQGAGKLQEAISLSLPLEEDLAVVFNQLKTLATINDISIDIFSVKPQPFRQLSEDKLLKEVGILQLSLKLIGSYQSFRSFIRNIETNIRLMDVKQVTIERLGTPANNVFVFNVIIDTYYQSDSQPDTNQ